MNSFKKYGCEQNVDGYNSKFEKRFNFLRFLYVGYCGVYALVRPFYVLNTLYVIQQIKQNNHQNYAHLSTLNIKFFSIRTI